MYESIVVPLDGSLYAEAALRHVTCQERDARRLTLVRVVHTFEELYGTKQPDPLESMEKTEDMLTQEAYAEQNAEARRYMDQIKGGLARDGIEVETLVVEGSPAEQVLDIATQVHADLIAVTSHGVSASGTQTKTGVFGKVADGILRSAEMPVLVIKPFKPRSY